MNEKNFIFCRYKPDHWETCGRFVVCFDRDQGTSTGVVVQSGAGDQSYPVGTHSQNWIPWTDRRAWEALSYAEVCYDWWHIDPGVINFPAYARNIPNVEEGDNPHHFVVKFEDATHGVVVEAHEDAAWKVGDSAETEPRLHWVSVHDSSAWEVLVNYEPPPPPPSPEELDILEDKKLRKGLDALLQTLKALPESRERGQAQLKLQEAIMWLGMDLKRLGGPNPYPNSYKENTKVDPTAEGLKL